MALSLAALALSAAAAFAIRSGGARREASRPAAEVARVSPSPPVAVPAESLPPRPSSPPPDTTRPSDSTSSTSTPAADRPVVAGGASLSPAASLLPGIETAIPEVDAAPPSESIAGADAVLLEVQLGRLARRVLKGYWTGEDVLLPVAAWLDFAEVRHETAGARVRGRLEPDRIRFQVDADSGFIRAGRQVLEGKGRELELIGGEVYASRRLISELLGLSTAVDRESATLMVYNPERLPIARRIGRESVRAIQAGSDRELPPELIHRGAERSRPGVILGYEVRGSSQDFQSATSYDLGLATSLARGSAVVRGRGSGDRAPELEGGWSRVWPDRQWLTQVRLGDGPSSGPRPQTSRGVWLSNAPVSRTLLVEDMPFAGTLPPDWSVEAYRAGRLIGFDSVGASGRYALTLPVQYGENPVDFVAYGPFGEVRTFNRTFRALPTMLSPGAFEYGVAGGACRDTRCRGAANLDLRYGASRRWTVRGGLDQFWREGRPAVTHAYAAVVGAPTNAFGVELEGVTRLLHRAGVRFEPSVRLRVSADYIAYADSGAGSPFLLPGAREQWSLYGRYMPGRRTGAVVLEAQGTRALTTSGTRTEARTGAAVQVENTVLRPYLRLEQPSPAGAGRQGYLGLDATILPRPSLGPVFGALWLQGVLESESGGSISRAGVVVSRNLGRGFRVEGGARWDRTQPGTMVTLSIVSQLQSVRSTSVLTAPSGGAPGRLDQSVGGSVVWSPSGGAPTLSSDPALDRGGIGGRVFLDLDADGELDAGEPPLPGTRLLVANRWVTADSSGRYRVWGLSPHEEVLVSVDSTSLASPWWMPGYAAEAVMPTPNLIQGADVPVVIGGVIEGMLVMAGPSSHPVSRPLAIELTELKSGSRTIVESFTDGTFYRMGLRPGHYQATVPPGFTAGSGLVADTLRFELTPGRSASDPGPTVSGLRLTLREVH